MAAEKHEPVPLLDAAQAARGVPPEVRELIGRLRAAGGRTWLVGGTVRDLLRGAVPEDFDVATDLPPASVAAALDHTDWKVQQAALAALETLESAGAVLMSEHQAAMAKALEVVVQGKDADGFEDV